MYRTNHMSWVIILAATVWASGVGEATAQPPPRLAIGVNHATTPSGVDALNVPDLAGAGVKSGAWNNVTMVPGTLGPGSVSVYNISDGTWAVDPSTTYDIEGMDMLWPNPNPVGSTLGTSPDDHLMYAGAAVEHGGWMTFGSLPAGFAQTGYDIYVYMSPSPNPPQAGNGEPFYHGLYHFALDFGGGSPPSDLFAWMDGSGDFPPPPLSPPSPSTGYKFNQQSTLPFPQPSDPDDLANFVVFKNVGLGQSGFTISFDNVEGGVARNLIAGIQVVQAGQDCLLGSSATLEFFGPDLNTLNFSHPDNPQWVVNPGVEFSSIPQPQPPGSGSGYPWEVDIWNGTIEINHLPINNNIGGGSFIGLVFTFTGSCPIANVMVDPSSTFMPTGVWSNPTQVFVNYAGIGNINPQQTITTLLNVTCGEPCTPPCVPGDDLVVDLTTGVADGGGFIPIGNADDTWAVTCEVVPNGLLPRPATVVAPYPAWATIPGSQWISANVSGPNGDYCYETCFCLADGFQNASAVFDIHADDSAGTGFPGGVFLNGNLLAVNPGSLPPSFINPPASFTITDQMLFHAGTNCLQVVVNNSGGVVTGFNLAGQVVADNAKCCPAGQDCLLGSSAKLESFSGPTLNFSHPANPQWVVNPGVEFSSNLIGGSGWPFEVDIWNGTIKINHLPALNNFSGGTFNGLVFTFTGSCPIANVTVDPSSTFMPTGVSSNPTQVFVDYAGMTINPPQTITTLLNVTCECEPCTTPPPGMVGWWTLDESSGGVSADSSGLGNTGYWEYGPTPVPGMVDGALRFGGPQVVVGSLPTDGAYTWLNVDAANATSTNHAIDFTIDAWIFQESAPLPTTAPIVDKRPKLHGGPSTELRGYYFFVRDTGQLGVILEDGGCGAQCTPVLFDATVLPLVPLNMWTHVAVIVKRAGIQPQTTVWLCVNGVCADLNIFDGWPCSMVNTAAFKIGRSALGYQTCPGTDSSGWFPGVIDEVEFFGRALDPAEIQAIYEAGEGGKCKEGTCGNNVHEGDEQCDGTDDANCPGQCQVDCTCGGPSQVCSNNVREGTEQCDGTDDAACPGLCLADCTCASEAIPTVSEWGLIVLALLLLVGIKIRFGRRQSEQAAA